MRLGGAACELGRSMVPMEECLVHLVPLRKLALPSDISDTEFGKFEGNHHAVRGSEFV